MYLGWFGLFGPSGWIQTFTQPEVISSKFRPFLKPARPNFWLKNKGQKVQDVQTYEVQFDPTKKQEQQQQQQQPNPNMFPHHFLFKNQCSKKPKKSRTVFFSGFVASTPSPLGLKACTPRSSSRIACVSPWVAVWLRKSSTVATTWPQVGRVGRVGAHLCWARGDFDGVCTHCSWMNWWMIRICMWQKEAKKTEDPAVLIFFRGDQYITFHVLFAACVDERNEDNYTRVW